MRLNLFVMLGMLAVSSAGYGASRNQIGSGQANQIAQTKRYATAPKPSPASTRRTFSNPVETDIAQWLPKEEPDARLIYARENPLQFADLRLPHRPAPKSGFPVIIFVHGGGLLSDWNKDYSQPLEEALAGLGYAIWSIEYRRIGNIDGGFPGTFSDVAHGADALRAIAPRYHLDLKRVIAVGHSSGGQLALWLAGRHNLPQDSVLFSRTPIELKGVVTMAAVTNLEDAVVNRGRKSILTMLGVASNEAAKPLYTQTSPITLLPLGVPQHLIEATKDLPDDAGDSVWRDAMNANYTAQAVAKGDRAEISRLPGANHFDLVDADGPAFDALKAAIAAILPVTAAR